MYFNRNEYDAYMSSDEWRRKAQQRLQVDGYKCQMCGRGTDEVALHVHHVKYKNFKNENVMKDLISLCPRCHEAVHAMMCRITGYSDDGTPVRGWRDTLPYYIRDALKRRGLA